MTPEPATDAEGFKGSFRASRSGGRSIPTSIARTTMQFVFRMPRFPVILDTGNALLCAKTPAELKRKVSGLAFSSESKAWVIDSTAEVFALHPSTMIVMPSIAQRRRTKTELIDLYNLKRSSAQPEYKTTSLGSKRVERVVADLGALLSASNEERR